jgi:hypothetical protein
LNEKADPVAEILEILDVVLAEAPAMAVAADLALIAIADLVLEANPEPQWDYTKQFAHSAE